MATPREISRVVVSVITIVAALWLLIGIGIPAGCYSRASNPASDLAIVQQLRGQLGDQFGMVNSIFSAFAFSAVIVGLYLQGRQLEQAVKSQETATELQTRVIAFELIVAVTDDIRSKEWGTAHHALVEWKQKHGSEFVKLFVETRKRTETDGAKVDAHRRVFIEPLYKVYNCAVAKVATADLVKVVITPDIVLTVLEVIEPLEKGIRANYDTRMFRYLESLYTKEELEAEGTYK